MFLVPSLLTSLAAHADPSIPWAPSASVRHDVELLADEARLDLVVTHWPLPRAAVQRAIDRLPPDMPQSLVFARERVLQALRLADESRLSVTAQGNAEALPGFGDDATLGSSAVLRSSAFHSSLLVGQVGARVESHSGLRGDDKLRLEDTALATEAFGVQFQAWSHRSWWGPGWQSSLVLGNNAPAFNGFGLQRASASRSDSPWLSWLGPWTYEMFIAQTEDVSQPANPYLVSQRLTFKPFSNLEVGLTRTAQWGGRGRQQTAKSFLHMLTGAGVNADTQDQQPSDPANEMAGYDFRLRCPGGLPCAAYLQLIGEDQAGLLPSHFLGLYGVESWSADGRQRYFAEYAETGCRAPIGRSIIKPCAYRNYEYPQGYANAGRWIGASLGPDSRVLTIGWLDAQAGSSLRLSLGKVGSRIGTFTADPNDPASSGRLVGVAASQKLEWGPAVVTPRLDWTHLQTPNGTKNMVRLGATLDVALDDAYRSTANAVGASPSSLPRLLADPPVWLAVGAVAASVLLDRPAGRYVNGHAQNASGRALEHTSAAVPVVAFGLAGLSWSLQRGSTQGDLAFAALSAGVSALVVSEAGKYAIDRARPSADRGAGSFGGPARLDSSFPSVHTAVAWAVLTPYAKYYDQPWLYGLAALTGVGRVASREHWVSDTVAGAAIGYYAGNWFYRRSGAGDDKNPVRVWITPRALLFRTSFD